MSKSLLDTTYELLEAAYASGIKQREVAEGAGVGYWWFIKFSQRAIPNPTVNNVQAVHDYLARRLDQAA
jgi:hypothetical protein